MGVHPPTRGASVITVHHLNHSRSQRILWLLEELGMEYAIVQYQRDPVTNLAPPGSSRRYTLWASLR